MIQATTDATSSKQAYAENDTGIQLLITEPESPRTEGTHQSDNNPLPDEMPQVLFNRVFHI